MNKFLSFVTFMGVMKCFSFTLSEKPYSYTNVQNDFNFSGKNRYVL